MEMPEDMEDCEEALLRERLTMGSFQEGIVGEGLTELHRVVFQELKHQVMKTEAERDCWVEFQASLVRKYCLMNCC